MTYTNRLKRRTRRAASLERRSRLNGATRSGRRRRVFATARVRIRPMRLQDIPHVYRLGSKLFTARTWPTLYRIWDEHDILQTFTAHAETCLVAQLAGGEQIVGFALGSMMAKPRNPWRYGWLEWLAVEPAYHRHKVATRLVKALTKLFIERSARIMLVDTSETNVRSLAFFRKNGFGGEIRHVYLSCNLNGHATAH